MATTTTRRRCTATPFTKAWNQAKKLDDGEKLQLITLLAESVKPAVTPRKPRLYDPETGEYLNEETMQAIEDVRSGKDQGTTYESFEVFKKAMMAL